MSAARILFLAAIVAFLTAPVPRAYSQAPIGEGGGTVALEQWPDSLPRLLDEMGDRAPYLLPRIDSLALDYRYAATDSTSRWSFVISWRPGRRVLYEGDVLPWREAPSRVRMVNVELSLDVRVAGQSEAEMIVGVDSMVLGPLPDRFAFNVTVNHDRVFLDTPAEEARRLLARGVTLGDPIVERMGFSASSGRQTGDRRPDARRRDDDPRPPSIYRPSTRIFIGWRVGPRPYYVGDGGRDDSRRAQRPRGDTIGRTAAAGDGGDESREGKDGGTRAGTSETDGSGRSEGRSTSDDDEDDDEDDTDLLVPALGAVVAVAAVGYAGGTVGLYGRGDTPIGLAAGRTTPRGGVQLQAAVNRAVLESGSGQKLTAKVLGFYDVFGGPVQPALGLGMQIDPEHDDPDFQPSASVGLVGNLGRIVFYGGFDAVQQTPEVGLTYNFRHRVRAETDGPSN